MTKTNTKYDAVIDAATNASDEQLQDMGNEIGEKFIEGADFSDDDEAQAEIVLSNPEVFDRTGQEAAFVDSLTGATPSVPNDGGLGALLGAIGAASPKLDDTDDLVDNEDDDEDGAVDSEVK